MFHNREEAALLLAEELKNRDLHQPVVLAIPRGGVVLGAVLARELDTDLGVVLVQKLRDPHQMDHAIGAIAETGEVHLTPRGEQIADCNCSFLVEETRRQTTELSRRRQLYTAVCAMPTLDGRTVILVDDGIATAATMVAALKRVHGSYHGRPRELLVAVPVAAPEGLAEIRPWCDGVICLHRPPSFWSLGPFYQDFAPVEDAQVLDLLREAQQRQMAPSA